MKPCGKDMPIEERLEHHSMPVTETGCVIWVGGCDTSGYGQICVDNKTKKAHRVAWEEENGPIPDGMYVLHTCDVPSCINERHLFLGTQQDNMDDKMAKGRHVTVNGEANHNAKLTDHQVLEIRASTGTYRAVAKKYGVTFGLISHIKSRRIWKHLDSEVIDEEIQIP